MYNYNNNNYTVITVYIHVYVMSYFSVNYFSSTTVSSESFLNGSSSVYVEQMYDHWKRDPSSVHSSWDSFFRNVDSGLGPGQAFQRPSAAAPPLSGGSSDVKTLQDHLKVQALIRAYQVMMVYTCTCSSLYPNEHIGTILC